MDDFPIEVKAGTQEPGTVLEYNLQAYVPVPTTGAAPVTGANRPDLAVSVIWKDTAGAALGEGFGPFIRDTVYQADITLTAGDGYAFDPAFSFAYPEGTVEDQSLDDAAEDPGRQRVRFVTVTYKPADIPIPIRVEDLDLTNHIPAPVTGDSPVKNFSGVTYSGSVIWDPPHGIFLAGTIYTAEVTLTPAPGYLFPGGDVEVIHEGADTRTLFTAPDNGSALRSGKITFTNPGFFSGKAGAADNSAVDQILASESSPSTTITLKAGTEEVSLGMGDLPAGGLVLQKTGGILAREIVIDGGGRTVAFTKPWKKDANDIPVPITVGDGVTLTLRNITFTYTPPPVSEGDKYANWCDGPFIIVQPGGRLVLESGAALSGFMYKGLSSNNYNYGGSAVRVNGADGKPGEFTMKGGEIRGTTYLTYYGSMGGAVMIDQGGKFYLYGGEIYDNHGGEPDPADGTGWDGGWAGGVSVGLGHNTGGLNADFYMRGGTIRDNTGGMGGGVVVYGTSHFYLSGGTISGNTGGKSGGVFIHSDAWMVMSAGEISDNKGEIGGGGVGALKGANAGFIMSGGAITGNKAPWGGGVGFSDTPLTMSGGTISGNTATGTNDPFGGGGVGQGRFELNIDGGGYGRGRFTMSGGTITGNKALFGNYSGGGYGGGVAIYHGSFIMSNGSITGNEAREYGGGVGIDESNDNPDFPGPGFVKTGGLIRAKNIGNFVFDGNDVKNDNGALIPNKGHAVYYNLDGLYLDTDAGPEVEMDSNTPGSGGGWEGP
jgi:hypothetical protein